MVYVGLFASPDSAQVRDGSPSGVALVLSRESIRVVALVHNGVAGNRTQTTGNGTDFKRVFKWGWLLVRKPGQSTTERLLFTRAPFAVLTSRCRLLRLQKAAEGLGVAELSARSVFFKQTRAEV